MYLFLIACRDVVGQVISYEERFYDGAKSRHMPENGAAEGARCCWFLGVWRLTGAFCWAGSMPGGFGWWHRRICMDDDSVVVSHSGSMNKQILDATTAERKGRKGRQPEPSITAEDGGRDYDLSYLEQWWAQILEHRFFHRHPALVS